MSPNWNDAEKLVIYELELHSRSLEKLDKKISEMNDMQIKILTELAGLKVKSGFWGLIGGAIPVLIGLAIYILKS